MENNELQHHGVKGQKWGVRRYQNRDGSLTKAGQRRYAKELEKTKKEEQRVKNKLKTQAKIDRLLKKQQDIEELKKRLDPDYRKMVDNKEKGIIEKATKPRKAKNLSDSELKKEYDRLKLEKEYKELYDATRGKTAKKAMAMIENWITKSADNLVPQLLNHLGAEELNKLLNATEEYERAKKDKDGNNILGDDGYPIMEKKERKLKPIYANNKKKDK